MGDHPLRPPTDRGVGEPLPHQLTNQTHAHPLPINLLPHHNAVSWSYGVLIRVSPGYLPVKGRLHTRYAPVRRSPSMYKQMMLPLDLHVLGLPLAFILSQDQTLHCNLNYIAQESSLNQRRSLNHLPESKQPQTINCLKNRPIFQRTSSNLVRPES